MAELSDHTMTERDLTHDEKKAAEAAFRGLPPNPNWSAAAQTVYDNIIKVLPSMEAPLIQRLAQDGEPEPQEVLREAAVDTAQGQATGSGKRSRGRQVRAEREMHAVQSGSRDQAIESGVLIDITPQAQEMGLPLPVGISRSLWDFGITASDQATDREQDQRVRDLLMALRLHLCRSPLVSPVTQFPALFSFPPEQSPQVCGVCAVVQAESADHPFLTLILPTELADTSPPGTAN